MKYGMKVKEVRRRMLASSGFKTKRKISLYNAKISKIMAGLNEGERVSSSIRADADIILVFACTDREVGERYKIPEVKRMVGADPSMLEGFTAEEEEAMVAAVHEKRKRKYRGTRANNLAAGADARRTVERLMVEVRSYSNWCNPTY